MLTAILSRTCLASSMNSRCRQHSRRAHSVDGNQAQSERQGPAHTPAQQLQTESSRIGRHRRSSPYRNLPCFQQLSCSAPLLVLVLGLGCTSESEARNSSNSMEMPLALARTPPVCRSTLRRIRGSRDARLPAPWRPTRPPFFPC